MSYYTKTFVKNRMSLLTISLIAFIPFIKSTQGLNDSLFAPHGCSYGKGLATCDFRQWTPPLLDRDFNPEPLHGLTLNYINGTIPAGAFSGLDGPLAKKDSSILLQCGGGKTKLSRDIFTPNLHWLRDLRITNCYFEHGLSSRLFANLQDLKYLIITDGKIDGLVAYDTLAGLTNVLGIAINSPVANGALPSGFFEGLKNLTIISLQQSELNFIPPNWFNGLDNLQQIYLSNNTLQTLPSELFHELKSLTYVWLQNNPWNCSCELKWLLEWSNITDSIVCQHPSGFESVELEEAIQSLDCTSSEQTVLSTPVSSETKVSEIWTTSPSSHAGTGSVSHNGRKEEGDTNNLRAIVLLSVFGALALMSSVAAVLYLSVCRHKCIGSMNLVSNGKEDRHNSDPRDE